MSTSNFPIEDIKPEQLVALHDTSEDWYKVLYHIFSNNVDEWTSNPATAIDIYNQWADENGCARLYAEYYLDEKRYEACDQNEEECLLTYGDYPQ